MIVCNVCVCSLCFLSLPSPGRTPTPHPNLTNPPPQSLFTLTSFSPPLPTPSLSCLLFFVRLCLQRLLHHAACTCLLLGPFSSASSGLTFSSVLYGSIGQGQSICTCRVTFLCQVLSNFPNLAFGEEDDFIYFFNIQTCLLLYFFHTRARTFACNIQVTFKFMEH